jgi:hypothetical protein
MLSFQSAKDMPPLKRQAITHFEALSDELIAFEAICNVTCPIFAVTTAVTIRYRYRPERYP